MRSGYETHKVLIIGKTYPSRSKKYRETVCTGGVLQNTMEFCRLYPIPFRYLDDDDKMKLYQIVEVDIKKDPSDPRPESYRVDLDNMKLLETIDTTKGWRERDKWLFTPNKLFSSVEELHSAQETKNTSLGLIKPGAIHKIYAEQLSEQDREEWEEKEKELTAQSDIFEEALPLDFIPIRYKVIFSCMNSNCRHDMSILDWGLYQLHRKMVKQYGQEKGQGKVIEKIQDIFDLSQKNTHIILGNFRTYWKTFTIVAIHYPPFKPQLELL